MTADYDYLFVCGFPRCGSSMTMQMLHAGGMPTLGTYPDFEDDRVIGLPAHTEWMRWFEGHAIKVLDPHRYTPPAHVDGRYIWLSRDSRQQALSQIKLYQLVDGYEPKKRHAKQLKRWIDTYEEQVMRMVQGRAPTLLLEFKDILDKPEAAAEEMAKFVGLETASVERMAEVVEPRSHVCADGLRREARLAAIADLMSGGAP